MKTPRQIIMDVFDADLSHAQVLASGKSAKEADEWRNKYHEQAIDDIQALVDEAAKKAASQ